LFSGIGGFSLGLERAGMQTAAFCESEKFCRRILAKHWPDVTIHKSIEELDGRQYRGSVELVCGGFPCQPFSVAGDQRGAEDDRALWPEMLRVIREVEPAWVIGENVTGIINMELGNCLSSLEDSDYACCTFVIPACGVDAPHRRDRVWIIARKNDPGRGNTEERRAESRPGNDEDVADSESQRVEGRGSTEQQESHLSAQSVLSGRNSSGSGTSVWSPQPGLGGNLSDGVSRWMDEPEGTPRVTKGCPDRTQRLKALGNAVVPQVVEVLGKFIMEIHHNNGHSTEDGD